MKTSSFIASLLLGSVALAAPLDRRALATKTETVIETQVIYVTVWDGQVPAAQPSTTAPGLFYEQPASSKPEPTTTATSSASPSPPEQKPTSEQQPQPTVAPTSTKEEPAPVYTPPPVQPSTEAPKPEPTQPPKEEPKPEPSTPAPAPAPAPSAPASPPAYNPPSNPPSGGGDQKSGDMTYYETLNDPGACGKGLKDDVPSAAISAAIWGNDVWGSADNINGNPSCSKSVTVTYNGKSLTVPVKDRCAGCKANDVDLTPAAWNYLTGNAYPGRETISWTWA